MPLQTGPTPRFVFDFHAQQALDQEAGRIFQEQLSWAGTNLGLAQQPNRLEASVHEARKTLKRLRALLRLLKPALTREAFAEANLRFRDLARELASGRDAHVLEERFAELLRQLEEGAARRTLAPLRQYFRKKADALDRGLLQDKLEALAAQLQDSEARPPGWTHRGLRLKDLGKGAGRAYARCRKALREAREAQTNEAFHEWRKQVKYWRHHLELLEPSAPAVLGSLEQLAHELADRLGEANDLAVLELELLPMLEAKPALSRLLERLRQRRAELWASALDLGRQLLAERPSAYAARILGYLRS